MYVNNATICNLFCTFLCLYVNQCIGKYQCQNILEAARQAKLTGTRYSATCMFTWTPQSGAEEHTFILYAFSCASAARWKRALAPARLLLMWSRCGCCLLVSPVFCVHSKPNVHSYRKLFCVRSDSLVSVIPAVGSNSMYTMLLIRLFATHNTHN